MGIIADTIEGSIRHTAAGWEDRRVYLVTGVTGEANRRKWTAANTSGIPRRGDPHPHAPGATVQSVSAEPHGDSENSIFRVTIEYGGDSEGAADSLQGTGIKDLEISTSTVTFASDEDINNEKLLVSYAGLPFKLQFNSQTPPVWTYYEQSALLTAEYEVSIVRAVVTVERNRPSLTEHKRVKMSTNVAPWSGDPAETWLILGVDSSVNGSGGFDWRYQLAHAEDTWRFRGEIGDTFLQGEQVTPELVVEGNGLEFFQMYRTVNFGSLDFEIPR